MKDFDRYVYENIKGHVLNPDTGPAKNAVEFLKKYYSAQTVTSRADIDKIAKRGEKIVYAAAADGKTILAGEGNASRAYVAVDGGDASTPHYKKLKVLLTRRSAVNWEAVVIKAASKQDADAIEKDMHGHVGVGSKGDGLDSKNLSIAVEKHIDTMGGTTDIIKRFLKAAIFSGQDPVTTIKTWGNQGVLFPNELRDIQNILDINVTGVKIRKGSIREEAETELQEMLDIIFEN